MGLKLIDQSTTSNHITVFDFSPILSHSQNSKVCPNLNNKLKFFSYFSILLKPRFQIDKKIWILKRISQPKIARDWRVLRQKYVESNTVHPRVACLTTINMIVALFPFMQMHFLRGREDAELFFRPPKKRYLSSNRLWSYLVCFYIENSSMYWSLTYKIWK